MKKPRQLRNHVRWMAVSSVVGSILLSAAPAQAADYTFDGPNGGAFDTAVNWWNVDFPDTVPGESDLAVLGTRAVEYSGATLPSMIVGGLTATTGSFTQTGGNLTVQLVDNYNFGTSGDTSSFSLEQNAVFNVNNGGGGFIFRIGSNSTATAFDMSGDAVLISNISNGYFVFGDSTTFTGTMSDNAHIDVQTGFAFFIGDNTAGVATLTMSGQSRITSAASNFLIGSGGDGTVTLNETASIEITANAMKLGGGGSGIGSGTVVLNDNAEITGTKILLLDTGNDTTIANGRLEMNGSSTVNVDLVTIGHLAGVGSTATVVVNAGATLTANDHITLGRDDQTTGSAEASLDINGGTVATRWIENGGSTEGSGAAHTVNVNGGTIRALETGTNFFPWSQNSTTSVTVNIEAGGLTFDTDIFEVGIEADLSGVGSLTKTGEGILTLNVPSSYTGNTIVEEGTLSISTAYLADLGSVFIEEGATLVLGFEGTDTIAALVIDGEAVEVGVYDSTDLPNFIEGTGSLTVTAVPEPSTLCLIGAGALGLLVLSRRRIRQRA